jgi:hypothetical protein
MKIPDPIMIPTTIMTESSNPSPRLNSRSYTGVSIDTISLCRFPDAHRRQKCQPDGDSLPLV